MHKTAGISAKQTRAVSALLTNAKIEAAAAVCGVSVRTLYQWLRQDTFRVALKTAQAAVIEHAQNRLITGQAAALDTLEELMQRAESESVRRQAALDWLTLLIRYREIGEFEDRLTTLERTIHP